MLASFDCSNIQTRIRVNIKPLLSDHCFCERILKMRSYALREITQSEPIPYRTAILVSSGDLRLSAIQTCWPAQGAMEKNLTSEFEKEGYKELITQYAPDTPRIRFVERFDFFERASKAFGVVTSGDTRKYSNVII
jgi:hypothetical protein